MSAKHICLSILLSVGLASSTSATSCWWYGTVDSDIYNQANYDRALNPPEPDSTTLINFSAVNYTPNYRVFRVENDTFEVSSMWSYSELASTANPYHSRVEIINATIDSADGAGSLTIGTIGPGATTWYMEDATVIFPTFVTVGRTIGAVGNPYNCVLHMEGNSTLTTDYLRVGRDTYGKVELYGGTININLSADWALYMEPADPYDLIDIRNDGKIRWPGDHTAAGDNKVPALIAADNIVAYGGDGHVNVKYIGGYTIVTAASLGEATEPYPPDDSSYAPQQLTLTWMPGQWANKHTVYFGTSKSEVDEGSTPVSVQQDANSYGQLTLNRGQEYFWRVDEVNTTLPETWTGEIWSFMVYDPNKLIRNPGFEIDVNPTDGIPDYWIDEWPSSPPKVMDPCEVNSGNYSWKSMNDTGDGVQAGAYSYYIPVEPDYVYELSSWIKSENGTEQIYLGWHEFHYDGVSYNDLRCNYFTIWSKTVATEWTQYTGSADITDPNVTHVKIVYLGPFQTIGTVWWDDMSLKVVEALPTQDVEVYSDNDILRVKDVKVSDLPTFTTIRFSPSEPNTYFEVLKGPEKGTIEGDGTSMLSYRAESLSGVLDSLTYRVYDNYGHYSNGATILLGLGMNVDDPNVGNRLPQGVLKSKRALYTDQAILNARILCDTQQDANSIRNNIVTKADVWTAFSDTELYDFLPDGSVPRAANVSAQGCPIHGKTIYEYGTYPWNKVSNEPFIIECPVGNKWFPSNDFHLFYDSGYSDLSSLQGDYIDPGRGWVDPNGDKYWLVAYANHLNWTNTRRKAVTNLAKAYLLTGDRLYAQKCIAMLDRIAEIYPGMDYCRQSRYGELRNGRYHGKILTHIWEANLFKDFAVSYDMVHDTLVGQNPITLSWRNDANSIRENIEANLLEEGIDAVYEDMIQGNYTYHQNALLNAVLVRDCNDFMSPALDFVLYQTGGDMIDEGFEYAIYNLIFKDGIPYETSPSYNYSWTYNFINMAETLKLTNYDLYDQEKFERILDGPLDIICVGDFTPAIGDAGSIYDKWIGPTYPPQNESVYRNRPTDKYAWALDYTGAIDDDEIDSFEDLFNESIYASARSRADNYTHRPQSRLFDGYGMAILNNQEDSMAVSLYYGVKGGHGHYDRLGFELYGYGRRLSPDLGYPDFMNAYVPGIYTWSTNTAAHNCMVVDDHRQSWDIWEIGGNVLRFHSIPGIHVVDVDGRSGVSYQQCNIYRRTLILVEVGQDDGYLIDIFRVKGGTENYVLSLHGNEGTFDFAGATLSDPCTEGTWAGADVEYGELYDQPDLQPGEYGAYTGSGYQHLENWQQADPDSNSVVVGSWSYSEPNSMLRAHIVPDPCQDIIVADGRVSPTGKIDAVLKYMLTQRTPDVTVGDNFVTVLEICGADPIIDHVEFEKNAVYGEGAEQVIMLSVHRTDGVVDTIAISPDDTVAYQVNMVPKISSDAVVALVRSEETALGQKINAYGFGGTYLVSQQSSVNHSIPETMTGTIQDCDYENKTITVDGMTLPADPNELIGSMIRIYNSDHSCMYKIDDIQSAGLNADITLAGSDIYTGRIKVNSIDPDTNQVFTVTNLLHPDNMSGMYLISDDTVWSNKIASVNTSGDIYTLELVSDPCNVSPEDNAWISDVGIGSSVEIERSLSLSKMNRVHNVSRNIWYETIQDAVDMAETTDEIEVLPGTYYETVNFDGWAGTLRSIDTNNLDVINSTIIDANDVDDGVVFDSGEVSDSVLCGLTIYKGAPYGIHCYRASPTINKCIIRDNATAGLLCNGAEADISNCIITGNDAGVHLFNNSSVNLNNCTIANNAYYGIYSDGSGSPNIRNTLLWGNDDDLVTCTANYSCIEDGDAGAGNINTNPDFVDLAGADYHLKSISPCINAGDPNSKHVNTVDIDGQSRLLYGRVDIGADEVVPIAGDIEIDEDIDLGDLMIFVRNWLSICSGPDWCQNCDFDQSGKIDLYDFAFMATHWLAGTE